MSDSTRQPPLGFDAVLFDLDGVVTRTAGMHAAAWAELFDDFLRRRAAERGEPFRPFDPGADYLAYVDGKPRYEGVRSFLAARGIALPEGDPADGPAAPTVHGLGARKDALFMGRLRRDGVEVFASTLALIRALRERGVKTAVVTSSRNGRELLRAAGIEELFDARLDGLDADALGLRGKPDPDPFLQCAALLGVAPGRAVVIEDAVPGVEAGRRGGFGLVVGVDRGGNRDALAAHGADLVVPDLGELSAADLDRPLREKRETIIAWQVEQEGFDPAREHAMESIFTVGNGYLGVRGMLDTPLLGSQGDLFIAGVYDRKHPERPYSELEFQGGGRGDYPYSELVSAPFPFRLRLAVDGAPLDLAGPHWREHRRVLDLRQGMLHAHDVYETEADRRTVVRTRRCASLADLHLLLQEVTVCLENHSGTVEVDASLTDPDLAANHPHLVPVSSGEPDPALDVHHFTTRASGIEIGLAARTTLVGSGRDAVRWRVPGAIGETFTFRRYVAVYTTRDVTDPRRAATEHVRALRWEAFEQALAAHTARWDAIWARRRGRPPRPARGGRALLAREPVARSLQRDGQQRPWDAPGLHGRDLAGAGVRLPRRALHGRGARARPRGRRAPAREVARGRARARLARARVPGGGRERGGAMSLFPSILVPLDGSRLAARSLGCATWLAARLGARLHILSATPQVRPAREELARRQVAEEQ
jgi:beta-phosphoglucomutase family hydrolase